MKEGREVSKRLREFWKMLRECTAGVWENVREYGTRRSSLFCKMCSEYPKNAVFGAYRNKNCNGYICREMPRNRIPISICVNFDKFRRHTASVRVDGIEKERGRYEGDVVLMEHIVGLSKDVSFF